MKYYIRTFGCQMNEYDSEKMAGVLTNGGYHFTESEEEADVIVVNTCSVRKLAEEKAFSYIGTMVKTKKVVVAGCMAQSMQDELKRIFPKLHAVIGTFNFKEVQKALEGPRRRIYTKESYDDEFPEIKRDKKVMGFIAIMRGCNNFCSYCIVPYVRGRERSRSLEDILLEVKDMVEEGFKDITLLGQNVNSYNDEKSGTTFPKLLSEVAKIDGLYRVRFMTCHPKDLNKEFVDMVASEPKVCNHFHLPIQSGSDSMLKNMNRKYTVKEYIEKVDIIRNAIPDAVITTDILVGFPGESKDDFEKTVELMNKVKFDAAYSYKYSSREGTKADEMNDDVPEEEKGRRVTHIVDMQKEITEERNKNDVGKIISVLGIELGEKEEGIISCMSEGMKKVYIKGNNDLIGKLFDVKISKTGRQSFEGELVK